MIDVSEYQGEINWREVRNAGIQRAFVKGGQYDIGRGDFRQDPFALVNLNEARREGIVTGLYWFATPGVAPHREASAFLRMFANQFRDGDIVPALDLETTAGHSWEYLNVWKAQWFAAVDHELGCRSFFYSYYYFWQKMTLFPDRPVWGAAYGASFKPPEQWTVHQFSSRGHVPGITGFVDFDRPLKPIPLLGGGSST